MLPVSENHPLRRLFAGLVESSFCSEVGICDPQLTDYLANLLVAFTHIDRLRAIRDAEGKRLEQLAAMLALALGEADAESRPTRDGRMFRHIGDYSLFWAGVYPEQLKRIRRDNPDVLLDYVAQGKRCYAIASGLTPDDAEPSSGLLRHLSHDFELCLYGLGLVRKGIDQIGLDGGSELVI